MKSKKILYYALSVLFFLSIIFTFIWFSPKSEKVQAISLDEAITLIKNKEASEITISDNTLNITDKSNRELVVKIDGFESIRDGILKTASENGAKVTFEPASNMWLWLVFINMLPFIVMLTGISVVIFYVLKSRCQDAKVEK